MPWKSQVWKSQVWKSQAWKSQVWKAKPDRRETKIVLGHAGSRMIITGRKYGWGGTEINTEVARV
jgi:hypothetical protein